MTTAAGDPFPERATIQAIAFVTAIGTLLLQGWTLPLLIRRLDLSTDDDQAYTVAETTKAEAVVHRAAEEVLADFRAHPPQGLDPAVLAQMRNTIARHSQDADEMPDPEAHTLRAETFAALYRSVLTGATLGTDRGARRWADRRRSGARHARTSGPAGGGCHGPVGEPLLKS